MNIIRYGNFFIVFSALLVGASIIALVMFRLNLGIDFVGGSLLEIEYAGDRPSQQEITDELSKLPVGTPSLQPIGEKGFVIRTGYLSQELHQQILFSIDKGRGVSEKKFEAIGPVIGKELRQKTLLMILLSALVIALYIAVAFKKAGGMAHLKSFHYSAIALVVTLHDLLIPLGVFALLGKFQGIQMTIPIVVGLLTVLGYSINDTIVVFDRIRENLQKRRGMNLAETVNTSLNQTLGRSTSTSATVLLVLLSLYLFGGTTLKDFSLVLIIGVVAGTYSSIFLAPPLLVLWRERSWGLTSILKSG